MSYCGPPDWVSDYHFSNALRFRLSDNDHSAPPDGATDSRALLLWGGVDAGGTPFLEPAFVVDAPASLPDRAGEYRVAGVAADGEELFSMNFPMTDVADGDGSSGFAFTVPVQSSWAEALATITLSGPGGSAVLDGHTDRAMAILRSPRSRQVRAILRDPLPPTQAAADGAGQSTGQGMELLFSRGIPSADAWRR